MDAGPHPELGDDAPLVDHHVLAPVQLHDAVPAHALPEVLVRRADDDLLHVAVVVGDGGAAGQRVVRLELDHRPHQDPEGGEGLLEGPGLGPQIGIDAVARLVAGPQVVAEGLDHVVGRHTDMGRALSEQLQHGADHAPTAATSSPAALRWGGAPKKWRNSS